MAELFGAIQRGLGMVLNGIYEVVPSYALAILGVTVASRLVLMPLTLKQMRSMRAMQKLQPELKEIQKKYKEMQRKVKDRREVQELRLKQNQEVSALFRQHHANPAGGCLPLLAQFPVFIALFSIMRASVFMVAFQATTIAGAPIPANEYTPEQRAATICRPTGMLGEQLRIDCLTQVEGQASETRQFLISEVRESDRAGNPRFETILDSDMVARCNPILDQEERNTLFACTSATGTGHLPRDGALFNDVNADRATILTMHPGCTPTQARNEIGLRQCTAGEEDTGFLAIAPYFMLVLLIGGTQYVAGKQMMAKQQGQQMAQQLAMMTKIMPIFIGFISLNFPTGLNTYYLTFNIWQMGQQHIILKKLDKEEAEAAQGKRSPRKRGLMDRAREAMEAQQQRARGETPTEPAAGAETPAAPATGGEGEVDSADGQGPPREKAPETTASENGAGAPAKKAHPRSKKKKRKRKKKRR